MKKNCKEELPRRQKSPFAVPIFWTHRNALVAGGYALDPTGARGAKPNGNTQRKRHLQFLSATARRAKHVLAI